MSSNVVPLIYVAGPLAAATPLAVRRNIERARDLGLLVAECGAYPVIPHTNTGEFFGLLNEETLWRPGALELLARCDGIALTYNWKQSKGATAELAWAVERGMPVYFSDDCCVTHSIAVERQRGTSFVDQVRRSLLVTTP